MSTELKVVMFTDQIDSMRRMQERSPLEIKRVAREQDDITAQVVSQCRGTILKDTGDGHFIEFLSCSDAVRCGFVLQSRVLERNAAQTNDRMKFELHIGIDFGEAVVLPGGDLRANTANLAARVSAKCPANEVYFTAKVMKELNPREARSEIACTVPLKGIDGEVDIYRLTEWLGEIEPTPNPFIWRGGIARSEDFFDRDNEQRTLRSYLRGRQNCQIVGPRRIGKTSLLRQIERFAAEWEKTAVVAYLDLQDPRCATLPGWLGRVSRQFNWSANAASLSEFADSVDAMLSKGLHPILCLDEFERLTARRDEFTGDFFLALRSCGQQGMSIVTAAQKPLSELTERGGETSPFYNAFPLVSLCRFPDPDTKDFVTLYRPGVPPFTEKERNAILKFAKRHPLALQAACFHVLEAKETGERTGESLNAALRRADDDMKAHLPTEW